MISAWILKKKKKIIRNFIDYVENGQIPHFCTFKLEYLKNLTRHFQISVFQCTHTHTHSVHQNLPETISLTLKPKESCIFVDQLIL